HCLGLGRRVRKGFEVSLQAFQTVVEVADSGGLHHADTGEWPRYELTLETAMRRPAGILVAVGGYFGVIARAATRFGHEAHVVDSYGLLSTDQSGLAKWWTQTGMVAHDLDLQAADLRLPFDDDSVDLVTLLAVIEHFPHTP